MTQNINNVNNTKEICIEEIIDKIKKYDNDSIKSLEKAIEIIEYLTPKNKGKGHNLSEMDEAEIIDLATDMLLATKISITKRGLED